MVGFAGREVEGSSLAWEGEGGRGETMTTTTTIVGTEGGGASTAAAGEDEGGGGGTGVAAIEDSDGGGGGRRLGPRSDEGSWDVGNHVVTIAIGLPSLQHTYCTKIPLLFLSTVPLRSSEHVRYMSPISLERESVCLETTLGINSMVVSKKHHRFSRKAVWPSSTKHEIIRTTTLSIVHTRSCDQPWARNGEPPPPPPRRPGRRTNATTSRTIPPRPPPPHPPPLPERRRRRI